MYKKVKLIALLGLAFSTLGVSSIQIAKAENEVPGGQTYYVDFFNNYLREDFTLSNGFKGKGNNLIYKTIEVRGANPISKPDDPTRRNYEFAGWYKEEACENAWNFTTDIVTHNTRLFAKWDIAQAAEIVEPEYTPPSTVLPSSASTTYVIDSIMNFKVENGSVKVSKAALDKLEANKTNVLPLMEYRVKANNTITATYNSNTITVTVGSETQNISVVDNSANLKMSNSNYESKASNYEKNALVEDSHHVMLAGSSSIEFWTSSKEDLDPIVSYNHGIGGTTIEEWDTKLNQRLVFPYKPKMVVYYVGINNVINSKQEPATIWSNLQKFFNDTHAAMPNTKVQYVLMNLIPGYVDYFTTINSVNANVIEYQKSNSSWLTLINPGTALLKENGEPNAAYFRTDGLHLSYYGYVVWGGIIKQSIVDGLENM